MSSNEPRRTVSGITRTVSQKVTTRVSFSPTSLLALLCSASPELRAVRTSAEENGFTQVEMYVDGSSTYGDGKVSLDAETPLVVEITFNQTQIQEI